MHRKFREKRTLYELLNEIEEVTKHLEDLQNSACLIDDYCKQHDDIPEIKNMLHLTDLFKVDLLYFVQELKNIIKNEKYKEYDITKNIGVDLDSSTVIFEDE